MSKFTVRVQKHFLSDHSEVFDVEFAGHSWHAVTERDAEMLADKIAAAFTEHTVDVVDRSFA